jgi:UDPglucose 6-dehydrogenase
MKSKHVAVVGSGYVGLVTGACLAEIGHRVVCVDSDRAKVRMLKKGHIPIYEPGLPEIVLSNRKARRLHFTNRLEEAMASAEYIFIAVNTPPLPNGEADLSYVETVARQVGRHLRRYTVVVDKSTVPVNTGDKVRQTLLLYGKKNVPFRRGVKPGIFAGRHGRFGLYETRPDCGGRGIKKSRNHDARTVRSGQSADDRHRHQKRRTDQARLQFVSGHKNFLRQRLGPNVRPGGRRRDPSDPGHGGRSTDRVVFSEGGVGLRRIVFSQDVSAFIHMAEEAGVDFKILRAVREVNDQARLWALERLKKALWNLRDKTVAVWGLAFKPDTDDLRNAPALDIIHRVQAEGCRVNALRSRGHGQSPGVGQKCAFLPQPYDAARGADAVLLCTEWKEFREVDLAKVKNLLRTPVFLDGRNLFDPAKVAAHGFQYHSVGRPTSS